MEVRKHLFKGVLALMLATPMTGEARDYVTSLPGVADCLKKAVAGDRVIIEAGTYRDVDLKWKAVGMKQAPITVEAKPGTVLITGRSSLVMGGKHLVVSGLEFRNGYPSRRSVVEFAGGKDFAQDCNLTCCVIDNYNTEDRSQSKSYICLSGQRNRVDHCELLRKYNLGVTLLVNLNGANNLNNHHQIDHNYFGPREVYGSNGAETMRIGTSQQSYETSATTVCDNFFDRCSGEVEVISIKSCDNIVRGNYLWECEGVVALRHGKRNLVENNTFVGNGKRNTGGVRVVDSDHVIRNNIFVSLAGQRFFSALGVMNAVPNSLPNRYVQVSDITITDNVYVDCTNLEFGTGADAERTSAPRSIDFKRNRLFVSGTQNSFQMVDKASEVRFADNIMNKNLEGLPSGIKIAKVKLPMVPTYQQMISRTIGKLSETAKTAKAEARTVMVAKDADLPQVLAQAEDGDSFVLQGDEYKLVKTVLVQKNVTIRSASGKTLLRSVGTSVPHLMTIDNGGSLEVEGLVFDGRLEPGGSSPETGISTANTMTTPYKLKVNNCKFINFGENGCAAIRGQKSTFADSLIVTGCLIADCSGGGVDFASEKDDKGRYNAENMLIENCEFRRLLGTPVNVYRGGSDESTAGPYVTVRNCFFYDCCNKQRGSVLRLMGPQYLRVSDCQFFNSGRGGVSVRLDETSWEDVVIERCKFENSGAVLAMRKEVYLNRQNQGL
ncbi:chondroitinase-B domain-containing protein [Segatella copri]|uniref:Poly(Beta-D-mannuronate) lyase n=1 Tax=Segatella copri TaxID=165179 RepID=A0AAW5UP93_9BACT|nr:chondroitinase-B domain-containing protein [Segatella copri]MCW4112053.1 poly(beta-D-mannuronate) lyase [Segatella copri]MCW4122237.1 poly(beta-D-mannuronate) lyase [Segatella copri]MCW4156005.1 poly(beta-D-mannuronate) lyase [Segatella copri]